MVRTEDDPNVSRKTVCAEAPHDAKAINVDSNQRPLRMRLAYSFPAFVLIYKQYRSEVINCNQVLMLFNLVSVVQMTLNTLIRYKVFTYVTSGIQILCTAIHSAVMAHRQSGVRFM